MTSFLFFSLQAIRRCPSVRPSVRPSLNRGRHLNRTWRPQLASPSTSWAKFSSELYKEKQPSGNTVDCLMTNSHRRRDDVIRCNAVRLRCERSRARHDPVFDRLLNPQAVICAVSSYSDTTGSLAHFENLRRSCTSQHDDATASCDKSLRLHVSYWLPSWKLGRDSFNCSINWQLRVWACVFILLCNIWQPKSTKNLSSKLFVFCVASTEQKKSSSDPRTPFNCRKS